VRLDEPYQHYQFAGRADVVAWDLEQGALLHLENRTRFPDVQGVAGSYNAKRAYLAQVLGARLGVRRWRSVTHALICLWSSEVLHSLRVRKETFRSLCPDTIEHWNGWWNGDRPSAGSHSVLVIADPLATGRQRSYVGLVELERVRPRYRGYGDAAEAFRRAGIA
jgi:hypothetical protein